MRTAFPSMLLIHPVLLLTFAHMTEKSMRFAKQNLFQSYKAPSHKQLSRKLLDQAYRSTEQLKFLLLLKSLDLLTISEH